MLRNLILPVAVTWVLTLSLGRADEPKPQDDKNGQGIRAEVRGTLHFESGRGYYISVNPTDKVGRETRVWLRAAEDKDLVRKLQASDGKAVIARGDLAQMPRDGGASVPPLSIYLRHGFSIERAGAK